VRSIPIVFAGGNYGLLQNKKANLY